MGTYCYRKATLPSKESDEKMGGFEEASKRATEELYTQEGYKIQGEDQAELIDSFIMVSMRMKEDVKQKVRLEGHFVTGEPSSPANLYSRLKNSRQSSKNLSSTFAKKSAVLEKSSPRAKEDKAKGKKSAYI
eukprot:TRINITY_DN13192_c0_g1_i4.p1 TRINITY_DN13192_c0_g1~~TRINITY_DN13192_c0_g1_i4.p1  ORF type:complete len:132 (+),score=45.40 TRINITY_DN13192_c0_g1_i4:131-526(+)